MTSLDLPPDQSFRTHKRNQQLIILSVAEDGVPMGSGTGFPTFDSPDYAQGVYIYAENVSVTDIRAPHGLTVSTWHLRGRDGDESTLGASGNRGSESEDSDGGPGAPGGTVELYVQDLSDGVAKALVLKACGGAGGDGNSPDAKGGDGGESGKIVSLLQFTYLRVRDSAQRYLNNKEFDPARKEHWDEMRVTKKDTLFAAARMLLAAGEQLAASEDKITEMFGKLRAELDKESSTVAALHRAANFAAFKLESHVNDQESLVGLSPENFRGGNPGTGGSANGKRGEDREGSESITVSSMADILRAAIPFAHPEQCTMLLERADMYFSINSPPMRSRAEALYQRLLERLDFLQSLPKPPGDLENRYKDLEDEKKKVMPTDSLESLRHIRETANARLRHLRYGTTDFYGHPEQWVPRASYSEYEHALDTALEDLKLFENAYIQYHRVLDKQDDWIDKVKQVSQQTTRIVARLDEDESRLFRELQDLDRRIAAKKYVVEGALQELDQALKEEKSKMEHAFLVSLSQVINAVKSVVLHPSWKVAATQTGELLFQGFTSLPTKTGGKVTKEYLASEFEKSEAKIDTLSLKLNLKSDGDYPLDQAYAKRLVVIKDHMMAELNKISGQALGYLHDATAKKNLKDRFDAYIQEITDRNGLIFRYNQHVKLIEENYNQRVKYEAEKRKVEDELAKEEPDPDLPTITAHLSTIYRVSRSRVMRLLDILLRALSFRTLGSHGVLDFTSGSGRNDVPLSLTFNELESAHDNIVKLFYRQIDAWGSEPVRFPLNFNENRGKRYHLDEDDREKLITKYSVTLSIPPVLQCSKEAGDFTGCCNVRICRARFGFTGLKTASGEIEARVQVVLTHDGNETIVSREKAIEFEHDPVSAIYSFVLGNDGSMQVLDDGNICLAEINQTASSYSPPGPFAKWTVDFTDGTEFDKLDFCCVTDAFFDFCGTNYAFGRGSLWSPTIATNAAERSILAPQSREYVQLPVR